MRLWHYELIPKLPQKQLCGQWRECIALLGNGWGKKHKTVDYVFKYPESHLVRYAYNVYAEMNRRGYNPNFTLVYNAMIKRLAESTVLSHIYGADTFYGNYPEHNDEYMAECLENLRSKGVVI
jgi:uncharacterized protein (TIGR02328 family)